MIVESGFALVGTQICGLSWWSGSGNTEDSFKSCGLCKRASIPVTFVLMMSISERCERICRSVSRAFCIKVEYPNRGNRGGT